MTSGGPVLAVDFGLRRCGLARSDPDRRIAFGLPTHEVLPGASLEERIRALHAEEPLSGVVLGYPRHLDGRPGDLTPRIAALGEWIGGELGLPVAYWDERWTSLEAERLLRDAPRRVRRDKGVRDRIAAQRILQSFLDAGCPFEAFARPRDDDPDPTEEAAS